MNLTGEMEIYEVCVWPDNTTTEQIFIYENIRTMGEAKLIIRDEHNGFLAQCVESGTLVCFTVLARLIRSTDNG